MIIKFRENTDHHLTIAIATNQITENELPIRKQRQIGHRHSNKKQDIMGSNKSQIETNIAQLAIAIATTTTNINREQQRTTE